MIQDDTYSKIKAYTGARPDIIAQVPKNAIKILDVGCSNGNLGAALRAMVPERIVEGIEYDENFCNEATLKLNRVIRADLNNFDWNRNFQESDFDCIILADVLEHIVDPWNTLSEATRHLKPGGTAIVSVPNIRHITAIRSIYFTGTFPRLSRGLFDRTHLRWFTSRDACKMLESAGLGTTSISATLRINDAPSTLLNRFCELHLTRFAHWKLIREFLGYQFVLVGVRPRHD